MALKKYRLGDLIKQRREKYDGTENLPIRGVSREGFIFPKQEDADMSIYNVFYKEDFVFNPARMELNSIALNTEFDKAICSSLYEIFYIVRKDVLLPMYLNIFIKRDEFARKCWFNAIGSARNYFRVPDLSEFEIELPDLKTQQDFVNIYLAMIENQRMYDQSLKDLKLVCDGYVEDLLKKYDRKKIKEYIREVFNKNDDDVYGPEFIQGISIKKEFTETKADLNGLSTKNYNIVAPDQFAFNPNTARMGEKICVAHNQTNNAILVSAIYPVFEVRDRNILDPRYLMLFFQREEFDRYVRFNSWGSARETFNYPDFEDVEIPIPPISVQRGIADIYDCFIERKAINEQLKNQIKSLCPILIKGSLGEVR